MKLKPIYGAYEQQKRQEQKQERLREKYHAGKGKTVVIHRDNRAVLPVPSGYKVNPV